MELIKTRRTQSERRRESEQGLMRAAIELIAEQGVGAVTFEMLGQRSGFSRGLVTQRFGSKRKLIEAVMHQLHEDQQRSLSAEGFEDMPGLDAILAYVDRALGRMAEWIEARAYFILLSSAVAESSDLKPMFRTTHAEVEDQLKRWVCKGQASGHIRPGADAKSTALMVGCLIFGISMQMMVDHTMDIASIRAQIVDTLRRSLAA